MAETTGYEIKKSVMPDLAWYALQVKTTHEKRVVSMLDYQEFERFLPLYKTKRRWSDRIKEVELPLFPGYVFCRFGRPARAAVLKTPSVLGIAGIGNIPAPIDESEINAIRAAIGLGLHLSPHPFLKVGHRVQIRCGSFYGMEGIIAEVRGRDRLILSISLLQRSVAVEIDSSWVTPTSNSSQIGGSAPVRSLA